MKHMANALGTYPHFATCVQIPEIGRTASCVVCWEPLEQRTESLCASGCRKCMFLCPLPGAL